MGINAQQLSTNHIMEQKFSYNKYAVYEFTSTTVIQSNKNFQIANNNTSNGNYIKLKAVLGYKL